MGCASGDAIQKNCPGRPGPKKCVDPNPPRVVPKVNGAVAKPKVSFTPTGSWSAWQTATATVTLAAGSNVVQLTSVGASGANVDSLAVVPLAIA